MVMIDVNAILPRFEAVAPFLDERGQRLLAASEAVSADFGGIAADTQMTGAAPSTLGRLREPDASRQHIIDDGGSRNGSRVRLWKCELQKLANKSGLNIVSSHLPPATSKRNRIEQRLFSFIRSNRRAKPFVSEAVCDQVIAATTAN